MAEYFRSWGLYIRGFRWLWTRGVSVMDDRIVARSNGRLIKYKPGWGPLWPRPFLLPYCSTYLVGILLGMGVISVSRAAEGSRIGATIDWVFQHILRQGPGHCAGAGPRLWGSRPCGWWVR